MSEAGSEKKQHSPEDTAIHNVMRSPDGRAATYGYLQSCGVFENIFDKDPIQHAYRAGKRAAGLGLEQMLKDLEPAYYVKMIEEYTNG